MEINEKIEEVEVETHPQKLLLEDRVALQEIDQMNQVLAYQFLLSKLYNRVSERMFRWDLMLS